jgi:glutamate N-acetyltransferase/amino-acid N-acetyltransferase
VVVNAGNANCATGEAGLKAARTVCAGVGNLLEAAPKFVMPSSTGIIGVPLPTEKLVDALPQLISERSSSLEALQSFARAIMTTDTRPKLASTKFTVAKREVSVTGVAKGSGMIHPNLATMLVYIFTDVEAEPSELSPILKDACSQSFNTISVDGDTSTNDTVLLLASGASGCSIQTRGVAQKFASAVKEVCRSLAEQIVADGEGVQHVIDLVVEGARTDGEAKKIGETIAQSLLVKTAWAGADPNWGRMLAAAGRAGVKLDPSRVDIFIGQHQVCKRGMAAEFDQSEAHALMKSPRYGIRLKIGPGRGKARIVTCDLTADYVHINADYST